MTEPSPADVGRGLLRRARTGALVTLRGADEPEPWPYGSLVLVACDHAANPILLLSDLAEHSHNIAVTDRVSLLIDETGSKSDPLEGPRLTVEGRARQTTDAGHRARFLARHPSAERYADFGDFVFYRIAVCRGHLVQGFGKIDWIDAGPLLFETARTGPLAAAEADVVTHMNTDHADAIGLYAVRLLGRAPGEWRMTGIDPQGCDLDAGDGRAARLAFGSVVSGPDEARAELVRLARAARTRGEQ